MNLLLLKTLLSKKGKDEGFTLPIVMAIGLVMVLLSTVSVIQASEENINAISQSQSSDALAAAEIGVARYRNLLLNNRVLAISNLAQWGGEDGQTTTPVVTNSWNDPTNWRDITGAPGNWQYRIVSYEYDRNGTQGDFDPVTGIPTNPAQDAFSQLADDGDGTTPFNAALNNHNDFDNNGESDAVGILVVQGRDGNDDSASVAQLEVTMPIGINTQDIPGTNPALWIGDASPTVGDGINVNGGNIVYQVVNSNTDPNDVNGQNTIAQARNIPELFDLSTVTDIRSFSGTTLGANTGTAVNFFDSTDNEMILGTAFDSVDPDENGDLDNDSDDDFDDDDLDNLRGRTPRVFAQNSGADGAFGTLDDLYVYQFENLLGSDPALTVSSGQRIEADGDRRVILHVNGNLTIETSSATRETQLVNSQHNTKNSEIARYFEIHVDGDVNITGDGDAKIVGLLRANGTVTVASTVSNVEVIGAIWAGNFNSQNSTNISITPDDLEFFSITDNRTAAPITYRPTGWETQEAE